MADAYIAIEEAGDINLTNYLNVDFRSKVQQYDYPGFKATVDELWKTGRVIQRALNDGFSTDRLGNIQNYYFEAIKWLKGQEQTTNWVNITPLGSNPSTVGTDVEQFNQSWFVNYMNTFFGNPLLTNYYIQQKRTGSSSAAGRLKTVAEDLEKTMQENVDVEAAKRVKQLTDLYESQIESYTKAVAIEQWQKHYADLIKVSTRPKLSLLQKKDFKDGTSYGELMEHYGLWRNVWLASLVIGLLLSVLITVRLGWTLQKNLTEILSLKVAVVALFGSLWASTNKNYRIYSNLYDQTRHRDVTAKTIQGIMLDDRFGEEEKRILLAVAAQTLFEMKPNGHLTKKESASPVNDLLVSVLSRDK